MDERYETLIANLAAIAAGQQILIDRLLRELPDVEGDADLQRIANDARVLLAATRLKAYQYVQPMFWPNVGRQYHDYFAQAVAADRMESAEPFRRNSSFSLKNPRGELLHKGM